MERSIYKNRIIGHGEKKASEFKFNPHNWKVHPQVQKDAIHSILSKIGWCAGVVEVFPSGNLLDGHARVAEALRRNPDELIPYTKVELTAEEEKEILLLLDPIGALAQTDHLLFENLSKLIQIEESALLEVLAEIKIPEGIETIPLEREPDTSPGETLEYLKFGGKQIPLTDEELAGLFGRYHAYCEKAGTHYGFVADLLGME